MTLNGYKLIFPINLYIIKMKKKIIKYFEKTDNEYVKNKCDKYFPSCIQE